jgi:hypothetical protein
MAVSGDLVSKILGNVALLALIGAVAEFVLLATWNRHYYDLPFPGLTKTFTFPISEKEGVRAILQSVIYLDENIARKEVPRNGNDMAYYLKVLPSWWLRRPAWDRIRLEYQERQETVEMTICVLPPVSLFFSVNIWLLREFLTSQSLLDAIDLLPFIGIVIMLYSVSFFFSCKVVRELQDAVRKSSITDIEVTTTVFKLPM